jgi:Protein of unknown function (DUF2771)
VKRVIASLAVVVLVASIGTGVLVWRLARNPAPKHPEISAYTDGQLTRVGPYRYCNVLNPFDCESPQKDGELIADRRHPVQLSVPPAIGRALWILVRSYEDGEIVETFRPHTTLAVTIPTFDAKRGRLFGLAVQLPTIVRDESGNEFPYAHAEWSVRMVWPQSAP